MGSIGYLLLEVGIGGVKPSIRVDVAISAYLK